MKINFKFEEEGKERGMDKESAEKMEALGNDFFNKILFAMGIDLDKKPSAETLIKSIAVITFVENLKELTQLLRIEEAIVLLDIVNDSMKGVVRVHREQKEREKANGNGKDDSEEKSDASTFSTH